MIIRDRKLAISALALFVGVFGGGFLRENCFAGTIRVVRNSQESIPISVKVGSITEIEFEEKIANITKSVPIDVLQIETLENRIFLLSLQNSDSDIYVVTQDNVLYALHITTVSVNNDNRVKIHKPPEKIVDISNKDEITTIDVMKALMTGSYPAGAVLVEGQNSELFNNGWLRLTTDKVFELSGGAKALVLTAENLIDKPIVIPIQNIELPGLLAISVDNEVLEGRSSEILKQRTGYTTKAYMVIED
ncbi:MAG TPA: hypothetical protein DCL49_04535 [Candidatus Omnitrophica bacterium]|nr:hypothetical protein [Candidatus Omnitrophota bacterium]